MLAFHYFLTQMYLFVWFGGCDGLAAKMKIGLPIWGLDQTTSRDSIQPQPFCDSVQVLFGFFFKLVVSSTSEKCEDKYFKSEIVSGNVGESGG